MSAIEEAIQQLLSIVQRLRKEYERTGRKFPLDGLLVGDLGEVLVEAAYQLNLVRPGNAGYDAEDVKGRRVQIKTTMKDSLYIHRKHIPYYFIGIEVHEDGSFSEVYNGPGAKVWEAFRPQTDVNDFILSKKKLYELNKTVNADDRIELRPDFYKDGNRIRKK
jgi:hypothetical protein